MITTRDRPRGWFRFESGALRAYTSKHWVAHGVSPRFNLRTARFGGPFACWVTQFSTGWTSAGPAATAVAGNVSKVSPVTAETAATRPGYARRPVVVRWMARVTAVLRGPERHRAVPLAHVVGTEPVLL